MADLSSCYFCGAAMDVSLREHPVVPEAFSPTADRQTTVVLCGTCERKLERVLDPVVDAAAAQRRAAAKDASAGDGATHGDAAAGNGASAGDGSTGGDADDDPAANLPPGGLLGVGDDQNESAGDADGETANQGDDASSAADDGTPFEVDDTASVFDDGADEAGSDSVFADESGASTATIPDAEAGRDNSDDGIAFDDGSTAGTPDGVENATNQRREPANATDDDAAGATDGNATTGGGSNASTGSDAGSETDTPDVDPRTYNKVVRLLKNRDLPVARTEIESIAGSAYDIPDHECEAIVDAAIQRGLVAEDGNQLTYPDGV